MEKIVILCVDDEPAVLNSLKTDLKRSLGPSYFVTIENRWLIIDTEDDDFFHD